MQKHLPFLKGTYDLRNCLNDISVNANPISVRLKTKQQLINTVTFYSRDILTPRIGVRFKHIDKYKNGFARQILISDLLCNGFFGSTITFKIVSVSQQRCPCIFSTKLPLPQFILDLLLSHFDLLISSDSLIFFTFVSWFSRQCLWV